MKIKLAADYRGDLTDEVFYLAGVYAVDADMPQGHADNLLAAGRAVVVEAVKVEPPAPKSQLSKRKGGL